jgi:hypothetical protein
MSVKDLNDAPERFYESLDITLETFRSDEVLRDHVVVEQFADFAHTLKEFVFAGLRQSPETRVVFEGFARANNFARLAHRERLSWTIF